MNNERPMSAELSRRNFHKLTVAAFGGLAAGTMIGGISRSALADDGEEAAGSLLLTGKNVCRGLNHKCANHKGGDNKCAGQGQCATAAAHACRGQNECKGEGGCGEKPGENACKGKGKCAVPLSDKAWKTARANFEEAMKAAGKKFGPAPAKG